MLVGEVPVSYLDKGDDGMKQGTAFVRFSSVEATMLAKDALEGIEVGGRNTRIDFAEDVPKGNAGKRPSPAAEHGEAKSPPSKRQRPNEGNQGGLPGTNAPSLEKLIDELDKNRKAGLLSEDGMMQGQREAKAEEDWKAQQDAGEL